MKIAINGLGVVLLLLGLVWMLQGANILGGSVMSGQSQWLYVGIAVVLAGLGLLYWYNLGGRRPRR